VFLANLVLSSHDAIAWDCSIAASQSICYSATIEILNYVISECIYASMICTLVS
jgi:hypothetical protein